MGESIRVTIQVVRGGGGGVHTGGESGFEFELEPSCKCCLWLISGLYISAEN